MKAVLRAGFSRLGTRLGGNGIFSLRCGVVDILDLPLGFAAIIGERSADVKNSGTFLPGIGCALDLIDSILFTAPLLYFYLRFLIRVA